MDKMTAEADTIDGLLKFSECFNGAHFDKAWMPNNIYINPGATLILRFKHWAACIDWIYAN